MRPRGDVRQALARAAEMLHVERGAVTHRDLAERAQVGYECARRTVDNMAEAGELRRVGHAKTAGGKWMTLFEPGERWCAGSLSASGDLFAVVVGWRTARR